MLLVQEEDRTAIAIGDYIRRARQERELAAKAITPQSVEAHLKLANYYEALVTRVETVAGEAKAVDQDDESLRMNSASSAYLPFEHPRMGRRLFSPALRF